MVLSFTLLFDSLCVSTVWKLTQGPESRLTLSSRIGPGRPGVSLPSTEGTMIAHTEGTTHAKYTASAATRSPRSGPLDNCIRFSNRCKRSIRSENAILLPVSSVFNKIVLPARDTGSRSPIEHSSTRLCITIGKSSPNRGGVGSPIVSRKEGPDLQATR